MEPWGWILTYLVGFALFQLVVFRYFSDGGAFGGVSLESGETAGPQTVENGGQAPEPAESAGATTGGVRCQNCGSYNEDEQAFTYCQRCLTQLQ